MKLFCILAVVLAIACAEESETNKGIEDQEALASVELLKTSQETLQEAASSYNYNQNSWDNAKYYKPPQNNNYYVPPSNNYVPPSNNYVPPSNNYVPPSNNYVPPSNNYVPPSNNYVPPSNNYVPPSNNYYPSHNYPSSTWAPTYAPSSTTTPIPVIKNEQSYGDNGSYKYEYEIADGTHVGEEGYFTNPNTDDESLVKKGWYSYPGPDGKVYTVTYWADHTGFHATGDHLPTPPPIPPAIQAAIEQNAKEEAAKAEAEKNKPQTGYYPTQKPTYYPNQPTYYPNQPSYYPNQPTYYPSQPSYNPQQNYPGYGK
ncbi:endocuticle structural glycoprotein SgAbd-1-like [Ostrinia furnacalis]|uniref:endocuticle structural glycoprotein SgAbd-1-like n=1 Tax=Ostrinia furnacalis TaxID=93504 RepID=UPI001038D75F|nr:endocuticle structural glycoprotein SgAbd-1-like [Ostrinia furnacalis]